ncbi:MAG: thiamine phosphate synthase [Planctomycetaceae bacterium]|jgi:thiamine-phosphate pyrophosphorylase|nr:thiamine phosphate synthase [Planctomycetaceae bacterium]
MRFDLTYAAFRVLDRAVGEQLPLCMSTEISAAKLLVALFKEEDCRAVQWLHEAGLYLVQFRHAFDLDTLEKSVYPPDYLADKDDDTIARLEMPISAPSFQVGSYGIPAEAYSGAAAANPNAINAVAVTNNPNSVTNITVPTDPDGGNSSSKYLPKRRNTQQEPDEVTLNENNSADQSPKRYYSLFTANSSNSVTDANKILQSTKHNNWFYVDDQPVAISQLSPELETAIETIGQQFRIFNKKDQKISLTNGGVRTIETTDNTYTINQLIATEHLLLAISMDSSDIGNWLKDHGLDSTTLRERIETLNNPNRINNNQFDHQFTQSENNLLKKTYLAEDFVDSTQDKIDSDQLSYKIYRLLDAAANRGREAVRVIEDYARFVIDNQVLTRKLKEFRHSLQMILSPIDFSKRLAARETENDIGKEIEAENEYYRNTTKNVIDANFARLQESLRSIEEFSKIHHNEVSKQIEQLRYQSYILHKEFPTANICNDNYTNLPDTTEPNQQHSIHTKNSDNKYGNNDDLLRRWLVELIGAAGLYVLVDCMENELVFKDVASQIIEGGADVIQLRDKSADDQTLLSRGNILRELAGSGTKRVLFVMNDRPDLAILTGADGVHVGQKDLSVANVRQIIGNKYLIGVSTHNIDQAHQAVIDGADYIGAGPVFESATKNFNSLAGIEFLNDVSRAIKIPAFAIGGINEDNITEIIAAGFTRIAVSNAIKNAQNPKQAAEKLRNFI